MSLDALCEGYLLLFKHSARYTKERELKKLAVENPKLFALILKHLKESPDAYKPKPENS